MQPPVYPVRRLGTEWVRPVRDTLMTRTVESRKPTQQSDYGDERAARLARISRGTKVVPEIQATEYVARMRGPSRRDLLRCDDGDFYVAKVRANPQHVRILANETLASRVCFDPGPLVNQATSPPLMN